MKEDLFETLMAFIKADGWADCYRILSEHRELMSDEVDAFLEHFILLVREEGSANDEQLLTESRALLTRCREVGVREAFAEKRLPTQASQEIVIPLGFEADVRQAQRLEAQTQRDLRAIGSMIQVYENILERLQPNEQLAFRAAIQNRLGQAYCNLPIGDREMNLARAREYYQEALRFWTAESAPFYYAMTQNNLGIVYASLPQGNSGVLRAIACYREALRFRTPERAPFDYATTQNNLGSAYCALSTGDRGENLEQAITCYQEALRFWTPEVAPFDYAITQNNLGTAIANLPKGDQAANLAQAIECYREALRFRTLSVTPFKYAITQNNLGNVYCDLPTGDRGKNLGQAIECFEEALRVYTPENAPFDYAITQNNLGNAYGDLPTPDQAANLTRAIECYREALRFRTFSAAPSDYAKSQNNLGLVYFRLPTGDRGQNLEQAIECYREALRVYTPETHPLDYAMVQNNLGNAVANLPTGDRGQNLVQAIECYKQALRFYTLSAAPREFAMTQNNLGTAYRILPTGDRAANLARAIECYREALRFRTPSTTPFDYAVTQNNLGVAYTDLPTGNRGENLRQAIQCYQEALRFCTSEAMPLRYATIQTNLGVAYSNLPTDDRDKHNAIKCYQQALRFRTPQTAPLDYATTQNNMGTAYFNLPTGDREANLGQARRSFQEALRFWTKDTAPHNCRVTNSNLGYLYFDQEDWSSAQAAYHSAQNAGERLYRAGLSAESKATEVAENVDLYRNAAYAAARLGHTTEALLILERGKTRLLSEALRLRVPRPANVPDEVWNAFFEAGAVVRAAQFEQTITSGDERDPVQVYANRVQVAQDASAALDATIKQVREHAPDFLSDIDLPAVQSLLPNKCTALLAFCITDAGSLGFVVSHNALSLVDVPDFTQNDLDRLLAERDEDGNLNGGWLGNYLSPDKSGWRSTMERVLAEVGEKLLGVIIAALPKDIKRLILLPSGGLFLLPLHAAPLSDNERVCDRYQVSYAPSAEVLTDLRRKTTNTSANDLLAVINPEEDPNLPFTPVEGAAISSLFDERQVLMRRAGTKEAVMNGVRGRAYLHFSCHGTYNWDDPPASALALADGRLTLAELQSGEVDMSAARLVTLSACETGMTDIIKGSPEEYVGLPAGFMLAGVPCVVASLWAVRDISTALLMERFYRNHLESGMDLVAALHEAQQWVRKLPIREVAKYAEKCFRQAKRKDKAQLFTHMNHYQYRAQQNPNERPFAHPYYWAAFTVNGM